MSTSSKRLIMTKMSSLYRLFQFVTEKMVTKHQRPLGRWNLNHNQFMKTDLANVDNCGDRLCKLPQSEKTRPSQTTLSITSPKKFIKR